MTYAFLKTGCLCAVTLVAGLAVAGPQTGERILNEDEIRTLTSGKTFHYTLLGEPRGDEQHYEDGRVTWVLPDGMCMRGVWIVKGEVLCYFYGITRYGCWNVIQGADEGYRHSPVDLDGAPDDDSPSVYINRISEEPVTCAPQQVASLSR